MITNPVCSTLATIVITTMHCHLPQCLRPAQPCGVLQGLMFRSTSAQLGRRRLARVT